MQCGLSVADRPRKRADDTYTLLEGLVSCSALIREERKSIVFVTNGLPHGRPGQCGDERRRRGELPKIGVSGGRIGPMPRGDVIAGRRRAFCNAERHAAGDRWTSASDSATC